MENQTNQTTKSKINKKLVVALCAFAAVIALLLVLYFTTRKAPTTGEKTITAEVVLLDGTTNSHTLTTEQEFLRGALEDAALIEGTESEYGLFVTTVEGVAADDSKQQWWCFTKGGAMLETGVDTTPIADGDTFEITLTEGY